VAASVTARGLDVGDLVADEIALRAAGPRDALTLTLGAQAGEGRLSAQARGALGPRAFAGALERLEVVPAQGEPWALAAPAALAIGRDGLRIAEACLVGGRARGCLGGAWHPTEPWRVSGQVRELAVGTFGALLARGLDYRGTLDLEFVADGTGPTVGDARAVLALSAGSIVQPPRRARRAAKGAPAPAATTLLDFEGGRIELSRQGQRNALDARFALVGGGRLDAELAAVGTGPFARRALSGRLRADVSQFALLPALLPELKSLAGRVVADVAVAGTVGEPRYSGRVALEDGSAALPQYGLELSEVGAELTGDGEALAFSGSARSGGVLRWRADMKRVDGRWRANGRVWGERVKVIDVPEARVTATPALLLDLAGDDLKVTGEVVVPRARIAPRSLESAVQATGDEVIVDPDGTGDRSDALRIDARVRLKLGDEVEFDGFGLTAKVRGEIAVTEKPGALAIASGELALVDGKYEAYGQNLTIERGRLLFSGGPVANPGLDVRAKRTVERPTEDEDVVVGIDVRGTLRSPETTIFATPAMSSSDALAYLVVGRPLADSTDAEQSQLSDAASSMKLTGGEFLAQQIGRRIGLDEVRVADGDDPEEAQLWLGTYLSPRLFVSYGMGLFEQFHTARVRYTISSKWSVEAESGRESSADFKYTIER
jgi:translocation and assembly module TamB